MIDMNDPESLAGHLGKLEPVEVLDPVRWRRPWPQWEPWALYLPGHQDKTRPQITVELRAPWRVRRESGWLTASTSNTSTSTLAVSVRLGPG